jgi:2,3-bisphosphoglycerate-dependent phosphoglycerate mutase
MQLYFVRHGQSENNLLLDRSGTSKGRIEDPPLTEVGRRQAEAVGKFFSMPWSTDAPNALANQNRNGFGITCVYSSLMIRAVATGAAIARGAGVRLIGWEDLHEGGGIYLEDELSGEYVGLPGKDRAYFDAHHPELVLPDDSYEYGWWNRPHETVERRRERAEHVLCELKKRHGPQDDRVVAITHGEFYNYVLAALFNLPNPSEGRFWFALNNVAVTRIDFLGDAAMPIYMNRVDFLADDLVT